MPAPARKCSLPFCGRVHYSLGYCRSHYEQDQKGELNFKGRRICTVSDCYDPLHGLERCKRHYAALIREQARKYREHLAGNISKRRSSRNAEPSEAA